MSDAGMAMRTGRFVGIGIDQYDESPPFGPLNAVAEIDAIAELLVDRGFEAHVLRNVSDGEAEDGLSSHLPAGGLTGGGLVVVWAGHGERTPTGELRLITKRAMPGAAATRTARQLVDFAGRSGASQVLVVLDTCFSGAAIPSAVEVIAGLREAFPERAGWFGVVASARAFERTRDGVFASEFTRVLRDGPRDPQLRLRFNAFNHGVRGDDVIDALKQEWPVEFEQRPDDLQTGLPMVMFRNPLWDPDAREVVVEHLLLAAQGRSADEEGDFFTGRLGPLELIVDWFNGPPGIKVVTGAPGAGKSAVVGRIVSLSNPTERTAILERGYSGPDPGESSIAAHVHVRRLTVDEVAGALDAQLSKGGLLPPSAERRNANELIGALQRQRERSSHGGGRGRLVNVVIDGLDEADANAEIIGVELIARLAPYCRLLVASRSIVGADGVDLLATLTAEPPIDLSDQRWADDSAADLHAYVLARLASTDTETMEPELVADHLVATGVTANEGAFLIARVVTSQLRESPVNTSADHWESQCCCQAAIGRFAGAGSV